MAKCVCTITGDGNITGILRFYQTSENSPTIIEGEIKGLTSGKKHAIAIHTWGDLTTGGGDNIGGIFNPFGKNHGSPTDEERMMGDLGNIEVPSSSASTPAGETAAATTTTATTTTTQKVQIKMENSYVKLIGPYSVIGRSVVIKANEDDCGRGGHDMSLVNGNAGAKIAAGVIGLSS